MIFSPVLGKLALDGGFARDEEGGFALDRLDGVRLDVRAEQVVREIDAVALVALRLKARHAGLVVDELGGNDLQIGAQQRLVEADQELAGLHAVAVLNADLADDATLAVLHLLGTALHDDYSRGDDGAGNMGERGPAADTAGEQRKRRQSRR